MLSSVVATMKFIVLKCAVSRPRARRFCVFDILKGHKHELRGFHYCITRATRSGSAVTARVSTAFAVNGGGCMH